MSRASAVEELAAVAAVAARLGLGPVTPEMIAPSNHSSVRLAPLPLVARVRSQGEVAHAAAALARELAVAAHLVRNDAPVVRPAATIDPGPHSHGRCAMTIWQFTQHRPASGADAPPAANALRNFHRAFAGFTEPLPPLTASIDACATLIDGDSAMPRLDSGDRRFMRALYPRLREALDRHDVRAVPIHGDAHLGNALVAPSGIVWADLDSACLGPREWDIACLPESVWALFEEYDPDLTRRLADLRSLCVAIWCWADFGRSPEIDEAAQYHLGELHERFG